MKIYKAYLSLISAVQNALFRQPSLCPDEQAALLTLWAGRGGGKSTVLNLIAEHLSASAVIIGPWDLAGEYFEKTVRDVLSCMQKLHSTQKKLVLFDNIDHLFLYSDEYFFDFEANVLRQLVAANTPVIVTSKVPLVCWKNYDVRVSSCNIHIPPLSQDDVIEWSEERHLDPKRIWNLSRGHPAVLSYLQEEPNLHPETLDRKINALFLGNLPLSLSELAMVASRFPSFDLAVLQLALMGIRPNKNVSLDDLHQGISRLVSCGLLFWDTDIGEYRFRESVVRYLISMSFLRSEPRKALMINKIAADYYQKKALMGSCLHRSLVNAVYHLAQICSWESDGKEEVVRWIEKTAFSGIWLDASREKALELWGTGNGDEEARRELRRLLGDENIARITKVLEASLQPEGLLHSLEQSWSQRLPSLPYPPSFSPSPRWELNP